MDFRVTESPMTTSTPGGTEIGVRPSFEGRGTVVEKFRGAVIDCHAGTKKPGRLTAADGDVKIAWRNAFALDGAKIAAIGYQLLPVSSSVVRIPVSDKSRSCN